MKIVGIDVGRDGVVEAQGGVRHGAAISQHYIKEPDVHLLDFMLSQKLPLGAVEFQHSAPEVDCRCGLVDLLRRMAASTCDGAHRRHDGNHAICDQAAHLLIFGRWAVFVFVAIAVLQVEDEQDEHQDGVNQCDKTQCNAKGADAFLDSVGERHRVTFGQIH